MKKIIVLFLFLFFTGCYTETSCIMDYDCETDEECAELKLYEVSCE